MTGTIRLSGPSNVNGIDLAAEANNISGIAVIAPVPRTKSQSGTSAVDTTLSDWPLITTLIPLRGDLLDCQINGGLIGHWSWAMMIIIGTIAYDIMVTRDSKKIVVGLLGMGLALTVAGWGIRAAGTKAYYAKAQP
jgi:hypothetical protein